MQVPAQKFCINLRRSTERRTYASRTLAMQGISFNFWEGVDGDVYKKAAFIGLTVATHLPKGKMGCYLAHYSLWKHCYEQGYEHVWIMEDDMWFDPVWKSEIANAPNVPYDLVYLCAWRHELPLNNREPDKNDKHISGRMYEVEKASSNLSYFASRNALKVLLEDMKTVEWHKDVQMRDKCFPKLKTYAFYPNIVYQHGALKSVVGELNK